VSQQERVNADEMLAATGIRGKMTCLVGREEVSWRALSGEDRSGGTRTRAKCFADTPGSPRSNIEQMLGVTVIAV